MATHIIKKPTFRDLAKVKFVLFDLAGTLVDYGCRAPVKAMLNTLNKTYGLSITEYDIRKDMGLDKRTHVSNILAMPHIAKQWSHAHNKPLTVAGFEVLLDDINSNLYKTTLEYSKLIPGSAELTQYLRANNIKVGITTGYSHGILEHIMPVLVNQGLYVDTYVASDQVRVSRPSPWMAHMAMKQMGIDIYYGERPVGLKVGDTVADIKEGRNAGCYTCNVILSSSDMGLEQHQLKRVPKEFRNYKMFELRTKWQTNYCDYYVNDISELKDCWLQNS